MFFEERRTKSPVTIEFIDEAARGYLTAAITHPAGGYKLAHQCIDDRVVGITRTPASEGAGLKLDRRGFRWPLTTKHRLPVEVGAPVEEFSPQQFKEQPVSRFIGDSLLLEIKNGMRHRGPTDCRWLAGRSVLEPSSPSRQLRVSLYLVMRSSS